MIKKLLKYRKPKITIKKIEMSFFLTNNYWLDQFNIIQQVYASSNTGGPECGGTGGGDCSTGTGG